MDHFMEWIQTIKVKFHYFLVNDTIFLSSFKEIIYIPNQHPLWFIQLHYSKKLKEHFEMVFIERYPLKRCQGCVKLIASKVNCFLNINDLSEVQLCMSSNSWTWECPHTKDGADHVL